MNLNGSGEAYIESVKKETEIHKATGY